MKRASEFCLFPSPPDNLAGSSRWAPGTQPSFESSCLQSLRIAQAQIHRSMANALRPQTASSLSSAPGQYTQGFPTQVHDQDEQKPRGNLCRGLESERNGAEPPCRKRPPSRPSNCPAGNIAAWLRRCAQLRRFPSRSNCRKNPLRSPAVESRAEDGFLSPGGGSCGSARSGKKSSSKCGREGEQLGSAFPSGACC